MIDLAPFCSRDQSRAVMCRPCTDGEHTYATDGRIAIRVPFAGGISDPFAASIKKLFDQLPALKEPIPTFDAKYLRLIQTLPDVRLSVHSYNQAARITFTGGEGILMPMRLK